MNHFDLTLKDIDYVLAVAEHLSFSKAAAMCAVSQPALSKQIKSIENTLGMVLFERSKRHVLVTPDGERFIGQARTVLDEAKKLVQLANPHHQPLSGLFRLGVIASSCPYLLPQFVGGLKTAYPDLKLVVKEGLTDNLVQELKQGHLDAVIAATTFEEETLNALPLFFEPFVLAYTPQPGHRYASRIDVRDIPLNELLLLEDGHCLKDQTVEICALSDDSPLTGFKATSLETLLQMTAGGLGVSIIPALAIPKSSKLSQDLVFSEFKNKRNGRTMALYSRKSYPYPGNIQHLARFIQANLPDAVESL